MRQSSLKRKISLCMAILVLFVVFYAELFIIMHYHHECSGADCPICAELQISQATIRQLGAVVLAVVVLFAHLVHIVKCESVISQVVLFVTPVKLKVRIDD